MSEELQGTVTYYMNQLRGGNRDGTGELWRHFHSRLVRLANSRLDSRFRRVTSGEDVAAIAIAECFKSLEEGRSPELTDRDDLWARLAQITERRALNEIRRQTTQKAGGGHVRGESVFATADESVAPGINGIAAREPTLEFADQLNDTVADLLTPLNDQLRSIAIMKLQGYTNREISEKIEVSMATVERKLAVVRKQMSVPETDG